MGLQIGFADLFLPLGIDRLDAAARQYVRVAVRLAAGEARLPAYDAAFPDIRSPNLCREEAEAARSLGFSGKSCIHPSQIAIANEVFAPRAGEIETWLREFGFDVVRLEHSGAVEFFEAKLIAKGTHL